jgi:hypothetical protein
MHQLVRTNDLVLLSRIEALLEGENIAYLVADGHMSALEGSIGFLPRRVLVRPADRLRARRLLVDFGLGDELTPEEPGGGA